MTYNLKILPSAEKEWQKLDPQVRKMFKKKLEERLQNPHVQKDKLRGCDDAYKIKLKKVGYRLVYTVEDDTLTVFMVAVDRRDEIYEIIKDILD